jgi:hypothetical protein
MDIITSCTRRLSALFTLLVLTCTAAFTAHAATVEPVDLGEVELGKTYEYSATSISGHFTSPATGVLTIDGETGLRFYTDEARSEGSEVESTWGGYGGPMGGYSTINVTANTTYYFYIGFAQTGKFCLSMDVELTVESISPEAGSTVSASGALSSIISFNAAVSIGSVTLSTGNTTIDITQAATVTGANVQVSLASRLLGWLNSGILKAGDEITLTLKDVKSVAGGKLYNGDGICTVKYISADKPATLVSQSVPSVFKSYWTTGDPDGILTLTFSRELLPGSAVASIAVGNVEGDTGSYYYEELPMTIEGEKVIIDLTGKLRRTVDMLPTGDKPDVITITLSHLKDINGNYVATTNSAYIGTFLFTLNYEELSKNEVYAQFTPENGTSLQGVENLNVWISGLSALNFSGFNFEYTDGNEVKNVVVAISACQYTGDNNEGTYTVPVPAEIAGKKNITVTLAELSSTDGIDHSADVKAQYDSFVVTFSYPADNAELAAVGSEINIDVNYAETYPELYVEYAIYDRNAANTDKELYKAAAPLTRDSYGSYSATIDGTYKLITGHTYEVVFTAWENEAAKTAGNDALGTASLTWYGTASAFRASDTKVKSITPADGADITHENNVFVIEFDGLVNLSSTNIYLLTEDNVITKFATLLPDDPQTANGTRYSNLWTLTAPASFMDNVVNNFSIVMRAYDMDNYLVTDVEEDATDDYYDEPIVFTYHFDSNGISLVSANAAAYVDGPVYNLYGVRVAASAAQLNTLPAGIYIVNGTKQVIK